MSPIQEALIYSFCENHDKAIHILEGVIASKPDISTYALLAKAQMKAKRIKVKSLTIDGLMFIKLCNRIHAYT
jgi:hypothetical protein